MIQGYIEIDSVEMTEEEREEFNKRMIELTVSHRLIKEANKDFYQIMIPGGENIEILLEELSYRNPVILGAWNKDGTEYGITLLDTIVTEISPNVYETVTKTILIVDPDKSYWEIEPTEETEGVIREPDLPIEVEEEILISKAVYEYEYITEGTPTYPYNKTKTETYLNDRLEDDDIVGKLHHIFAGFTVPICF